MKFPENAMPDQPSPKSPEPSVEELEQWKKRSLENVIAEWKEDHPGEELPVGMQQHLRRNNGR